MHAFLKVVVRKIIHFHVWVSEVSFLTIIYFRHISPLINSFLEEKHIASHNSETFGQLQTHSGLNRDLQIKTANVLGSH